MLITILVSIKNAVLNLLHVLHVSSTSNSSKLTAVLEVIDSKIVLRYLNISRTCGRATVYDGCGCDYVWIYEPPFEEVSGEQFCGRFLDNSTGSLSYVSRTKNVAVTFIYSTEYNHAFTLDFASERNRIVYNGYPKLPNMNNASQTLTSSFFPYYYPSDLSMEHVINCETTEMCRISLVFSDFQLARSSIIEVSSD